MTEQQGRITPERRRLLLSMLSLLGGAVGLSAATRQRVKPQVYQGPELFAIVTDAQATALYHTRDCQWVLNRGHLLFSEEDLKKRYFLPHCVCVKEKAGAPKCEPGCDA
jgi:hypothetical protein